MIRYLRFSILLGLSALFLFLHMINTPHADPKKLFIQIWTVGPEVEIDDGVDVGRIEIELDGEFVACVEGKAIKDWNTLKLAPISIGFTAKGERDKLVLKPSGELKRLMKIETKITEIE